MGPRTDRRPTWLAFVLLTLLLAAGIFTGAVIDRMPLPSSLSWLLPLVLLAPGLGLFLRRFNSWYLFVALPLAAVLAWSVANRVRPNGFPGRQPPAVELPARSAPLGLAFGTGLAVDRSWRDDMFVALHGSEIRRRAGYKVVRIPFRQGKPAGPPEDVLAGWLDGGRAWGRPAGLAVGPDGALYLSDDRAGVVYRIVFRPGGDDG